MLARCAVGLALLTSSIHGQAKMPPIQPQITGVFPRGARLGTEIEVALQGRNLQTTRIIQFRSPKLTAVVLGSDAYGVKARIRVAADAEPGRHDLRLSADHGSAIAYFTVGQLPERQEKEPNDEAGKGEPLQFPITVNGQLSAGDYDYFQFQASAGEVLTFDVLATRNGAQTDAALSILDRGGEELAYSDDFYGFKDPHLSWVAPADGRYFVRVFGSSEAGCDGCDYRLTAGRMPHAYMAMPAGARRGTTVQLKLRGTNLTGVRKVTLGDGIAQAEVASSKFDEALVQLKVPDNAPAGALKLHIEGASQPVPFVISEFNELDVSDKRARNRKDPVPVTLPVVANGVIDAPRAADHFVFRVDEPKTVVLEAHAMQLDYLTDPLVAIYDESGKRIAYQDDPTTNTGKEPANMDPHLVVKLPAAGRYTAMVRDAQFRGDPTFLYRLTMKYAEPHFTLRTVGTDETLYRGRTNTVLVRVRRLEGWNAPVQVRAVNLPRGVHVEPVVAEPKNTPYTGTCGETHYLDGTNVEMQITVDKDAPATQADIFFEGIGVHEGVKHAARSRARYFKSRIRHIGDAEHDPLRAVIADAPGVVFQVPRTLSLSAAGEASMTAVVTRLDGTSDPLELTLEAAAEGLNMKSAVVPPSATRADVSLKADLSAPGEFVLVGRVNGTVLGKSHPIRVRREKQ